MPSAPPLTGRRIAALAVVAAALHGGFDALSLLLPAATPPYLRLQDAPEAFQILSPLAVSIAASCVSGIIGLIAVVALDPPRRRPVPIATLVTVLWLFSAVLMRAAWLSTPWTTTSVSLAFGVVRGVVVGWTLARLGSPPRLSASTRAAA